MIRRFAFWRLYLARAAANEEADIANAAYWDEVARQDGAA